MGGEKTDTYAKNRSNLGSPPHGRGKADATSHGFLAQGITPAWAGKRKRASEYTRPLWDHPRMGGEKFMRMAKPLRKLGSPPHGRGKAEIESYADECDRITPAWAGKSDLGCSMFCASWDHPRMGGEKADAYAKQCPYLGSPPHGRGKDLNVTEINYPRRITPAWAGKRNRGHDLK